MGKPLSAVEKQMYFVDGGAELSPLACAYIRARGADRLSSYGDWAALSDVCDATTAAYLKPEVSDGVIAPGYTAEALEILKTKKKGNYNIVQIDRDYIPAPTERKDVFGVTFEQGRNEFRIDETLLGNIVTENKDLPESAKTDMAVVVAPENTEKFIAAAQEENLEAYLVAVVTKSPRMVMDASRNTEWNTLVSLVC